MWKNHYLSLICLIFLHYFAHSTFSSTFAPKSPTLFQNEEFAFHCPDGIHRLERAGTGHHTRTAAGGGYHHRGCGLFLQERYHDLPSHAGQGENQRQRHHLGAPDRRGIHDCGHRLHRQGLQDGTHTSLVRGAGERRGLRGAYGLADVG